MRAESKTRLEAELRTLANAWNTGGPTRLEQSVLERVLVDLRDFTYQFENARGETIIGDLPRMPIEPTPLDHPRILHAPNIFHEIRERGPILLQHPYESFVTSVERFLHDASRDPKVLAIKMTLYRTAEDSAVIRHLIEAAQASRRIPRTLAFFPAAAQARLRPRAAIGARHEPRRMSWRHHRRRRPRRLRRRRGTRNREPEPAAAPRTGRRTSELR